MCTRPIELGRCVVCLRYNSYHRLCYVCYEDRYKLLFHKRHPSVLSKLMRRELGLRIK